MLSVTDLVVRADETDIVKGISFTIPDGGILGLVGESGSGKTTTALSIAGLLKPGMERVKGSVILNGTELTTLSEKERRQILGDQIGMIFQEPMTALDPTMKIGKQVEEALSIHTALKKKERREKTIEALTEVELTQPETLLNKYPHELSGGQRQRVLIAAAMVCEPDLLIADEPTTALDEGTRESVLNLLKKLNQKYHMDILFISHDLKTVRNFCDTVAVMKEGKIVEAGETVGIFDHPKDPYTKALLAAIPSTEGKKRRFEWT